MFRLRPETEIANVFFSASPNLIAIERLPSVSVSSSVAPVVFTRRSARPPAETGPTAALSVPDAWPAMPFGVTRNAPSPAESVTPATVALTLTAAIRVWPLPWSNRKSPESVLPPKVSEAPIALTVTVGPAGRSSSAAVEVLIAIEIVPPLRTMPGSVNGGFGDREAARDAGLA